MDAGIIAMLSLTMYLSFGGALPLCFGLALAVMHFCGGVSMVGMLLYGFQQLVSPVLLSIPIFVFAGGIMGESGIAKQLLDFVNIFVGRIRGGLGVVSVITCAIIGAISGSGMTGVAAIAPIMIPRMVEEGYPRGYATALVTTSSILGLLIPPSISMITYGWVTESSILACMMATLVPGLLVTLLFSVINLFCVRNFDLVLTQDKTTTKEKLSQARKSFRGAFPALMMPVIILGGIYGGIMTPTEAASVAAGYAIVIGWFVYKGLNRKNYVEIASNSATTVASIMVMIMVCMCLGQAFVMVGLPQRISEGIMSISNNKYMILLLLNILFIIMGMLVSDMVTIILVVPLILPLVLSTGIDIIHFASIVGVNLAMGNVTPPYATGLYLGIKLGNSTFADVMKTVVILLFFAYFPVLIIVNLVPSIPLSLPRLLGLV